MNNALKNNWSNFNKHIADDNFYYLRSCIRQNFFPGSEWVFLDITRNVLGLNITDDPKHTTCAGIAYHSDLIPFDTLQTIAARHFALMTEMGICNAVVSCITSFGIYSEILATWEEHPEELEKVRHFLRTSTGREFNIPENVVHASDLLYKYRNHIAAKAKYQLVDKFTGAPLKIVDHIGCHYSKMFPDRGIGGAEFPKVLTGMITTWGGQTVDYPERRHCCGFGFRHYLVKNNRGYALANSKKKFDSMEPYHPDAIIANCPGCAMFLDRWQYTIAQTDGKIYGANNEGIPVFTYEELAGLVLGYNPWQLGLQMHQVDTESFLNQIGIVYSPESKYLGVNGKYMGQPEFSGCFNPVLCDGK